jgi:amino-acid N-acetyltransferase
MDSIWPTACDLRSVHQERSPADSGDVTIRRASTEDLDAIEALLGESCLPVVGVLEGSSMYWLAESSDAAIGVVGMEWSREVALLRSLAVQRMWRRRGYGRRLVDEALEEARRRACRRVYVLSSRVPEYWLRLGFREALVDQVLAFVAAPLVSACSPFEPVDFGRAWSRDLD